MSPQRADAPVKVFEPLTARPMFPTEPPLVVPWSWLLTLREAA